MKNIVILAPHVDDEVIGCYSLFTDGYDRVKQVIYFYDLTDNRKDEAIEASKFFKFDASFDGYDAIIDKDAILCVPNISDAHPHHKAVNQYAKTLSNEKLYYSVDMNRDFVVLDEADQKFKLTMLRQIYPSQVKLFESDAKYHLFESITPDDSFKKICVTFQ